MVSLSSDTAELLEQIIHLFDAPVLGLDENRKIVAVNKKAEKMIGRTTSELRGHFFAGALGIAENFANEICPEEFINHCNEGISWEEVEYSFNSESTKPARIRRKAVRFSNGARAILISLSPPDPWEVRPTNTIIPAPMVFFELDRRGVIRIGREFFEEVLGYEAGELEGVFLKDLVRANHAEALDQIWTGILQGENMKGREFALRNARKEHQPFWIWLFLETGQFGRSVNIRGIAVNLGMERGLALALEASEERFSVLFRDSSDPVMILSLDGDVLSTNHAFERVTGLTAAQLFRGEKDWEDFIHEDDLQIVRTHLDRCIEHGEESGFESRFLANADHEIWYEHRLSILHDENGAGCGILAVSRNVDRRKHLEQQLRGEVETMERKHQQAQGLISKLKTFFTDVNGLPIELEGFLAGVCGIMNEMYKPRLILITVLSEGQEPQIYFSASEPPDGMLDAWKETEPTGFCAQMLDSTLPLISNTLDTTEPYSSDPYIKKFGFKTYFGAPLHDPSGQKMGALSLLDTHSRDFDNQDVELVTVAAMHIAAHIKAKEHEEVKSKLEDHLLRSQKMEAVGMLAGGVAHDFNNILTGILGFSSHLLTKTEPGTEIHGDLQLIEQSAVRASGLTRQLLAFARKKSFTKKPVNMNEVILGVLDIVRATISKDIHIEDKLLHGLPNVLGDSGQLNQIIMNLCINASQAMAEDGGLIRVTTDLRTLTGEEAEVFQEATDDRYICLRISDTGQGMSPDIQEHVFDPFFTTRSDVGGTGLGLSIVYGIVNNHGGEIMLKSEEGKGTSFTVFLPVHHGEEVAEVDKVPDNRLDGTEKVMVVDDEEIIRRMVVQVLSDKGYEVTSVDSGMEAVEKIKDPKNEFDLILLDIIMPDMDGEATYNEVRKYNQDVPVLLTSGYTMNETRERLMDAGAVGIIFKPYKNVDLLKQLRSILDKATAASTSLKNPRIKG